MATPILVPILGEAIGEARVVAWLKHPGDTVRRGDELAELETDKAILALECPAEGVLLDILVSEGTLVTTGQLLAHVGHLGEAMAPIATTSTAISDPAVTTLGTGVLPTSVGSSVHSEPTAFGAGLPSASAETDTTITAVPTESERRRISPAARRMARDLGIDLGNLTPSKPDARVTTQDVINLAAAQTSGNRLPQRRQLLSDVQRVMAHRMLRSVREIPQFSATIDADVTHLLWMQRELAGAGSGSMGHTSDQGGKAVSLTALLIYLAARVLTQHPLLNARYDDDAVILYQTVNMGVAVTTPQGLVVPVLHGADQLSIRELAQRWGDLAQVARSGRLSLGQVSDGTFTLSNLGMYGVREFIPLVNPSQTAILGVGGVQPAIQPEINGTKHVQRMSLTVSADHRVVDGAAAAAFLHDLKLRVEQASIT